MPIYEYRCARCNRAKSETRTIADRDKCPRCHLCRRRMQRILFPKPDVRVSCGAGWPMVSDAAAVAPSQISEAREIDRANGVPTNYTPQGQPVFENRAHRKRYLRAHRMFDKSGGYGD